MKLCSKGKYSNLIALTHIFMVFQVIYIQRHTHIEVSAGLSSSFGKPFISCWAFAEVE